jgi:hypothetical protein
MNSPKPAAIARTGGGFNRMADDFGEHLEVNAMQQAVQQKALSQQQASGAGQAVQPPQQGQQTTPGVPPDPPREIGTVQEEFKRMGQDVATGVKDFFSINTWLQINPEAKDPEELAKRRQVHARFKELDEEQQAVARQMYEAELQKKKAAEEEEAQRKQAQEAQKEQELPMPSSPQKGPVGPAGSGKKRAIQKLQQDRQGIRSLSGSN